MSDNHPIQAPRRVLVIRLGALGDVANTLPAVHALRRHAPEMRVEWLVEEASQGLVKASRIADDVALFPRREISRLLRRPWLWPRAAAKLARFVRELRARRCDCVLDFQGNFKSALLALACGARRRVGFAREHGRECNWLFMTDHAAPAARRVLRAEKNLALVRRVVPDAELQPVPVPANPESAARVTAFLAAQPGAGPLVVMHPGVSAFGAFKRWPAARFGELAERLKRTLDARCVVTFGPAERELAQEVVAASQGAAVAAPPLSLAELIELLRRADVMVAADTGPLHIAALLGRPTAAIFGPKDPAIYAPFGGRSAVVTADVDCRPCTRRRCDDMRCIRAISVEQVQDAVKKLLSRQG